MATPFVGRVAVFGSQGWVEIRDRTRPGHSTGWDVTSVPPHPTVRDNLEAFVRAAAGQAPYPISLDDMATNVRTFEAITRSALSGRIERV